MAGGEFRGQQGWTVGLFAWLDDPSSKVNRYWRGIEEGSSGSLGRHIIGLWGPNAGTNNRPNSIIGGALSSFGGAGQKFVPFAVKEGENQLQTARRAFWYFMGGGHGPNMMLLNPQKRNTMNERRRMFWWFMTKASEGQIPFVQGRIERSMKGRHHYERAVAALNPAALELQYLREELGAAWSGLYRGQAPEAKQAARLENLLPGVLQFGASSSIVGRDALGRFSEMDGIIASVNERVAAQFQRKVVELILADTFTRPETGDLVKATADPRNRYPN